MNVACQGSRVVHKEARPSADSDASSSVLADRHLVIEVHVRTSECGHTRLHVAADDAVSERCHAVVVVDRGSMPSVPLEPASHRIDSRAARHSHSVLAAVDHGRVQHLSLGGAGHKQARHAPLPGHDQGVEHDYTPANACRRVESPIDVGGLSMGGAATINHMSKANAEFVVAWAGVRLIRLHRPVPSGRDCNDKRFSRRVLLL